MKKQFVCIWMGSYGNQTDMEGINFFTEERGYTKGNILAIECLNVGQMFELEKKEHLIVRVSDIKE